MAFQNSFLFSGSPPPSFRWLFLFLCYIIRAFLAQTVSFPFLLHKTMLWGLICRTSVFGSPVISPRGTVKAHSFSKLHFSLTSQSSLPWHRRATCPQLYPVQIWSRLESSFGWYSIFSLMPSRHKSKHSGAKWVWRGSLHNVFRCQQNLVFCPPLAMPLRGREWLHKYYRPDKMSPRLLPFPFAHLSMPLSSLSRENRENFAIFLCPSSLNFFLEAVHLHIPDQHILCFQKMTKERLQQNLLTTITTTKLAYNKVFSICESLHNSSLNFCGGG